MTGFRLIHIVLYPPFPLSLFHKLVTETIYICLIYPPFFLFVNQRKVARQISGSFRLRKEQSLKDIENSKANWNRQIVGEKPPVDPLQLQNS